MQSIQWAHELILGSGGISYEKKANGQQGSILKYDVKSMITLGINNNIWATQNEIDLTKRYHNRLVSSKTRICILRLATDTPYGFTIAPVYIFRTWWLSILKPSGLYQLPSAFNIISHLDDPMLVCHCILCKLGFKPMVVHSSRSPKRFWRK